MPPPITLPSLLSKPRRGGRGTPKTNLAGAWHRLASASLGDFSIAKLAISRIAQMEEEVRQFEADLSAAHSRLERAREDAAGLQPPDLQGVERDLAAAKEQVATLVKDQHELSESVKSADRFLEQLKETREKLASLEMLLMASTGKLRGLPAVTTSCESPFSVSSKAHFSRMYFRRPPCGCAG